MVSVYGEQEQGALQVEIQWKNPSPKEHYDWPISGGVRRVTWLQQRAPIA